MLAQHLERFPFEVIVKWLPSTLRTQNPGTADCFDIQLKTSKGPRELRVKADSEKQSQKILKQLEATVQDLVDKRKALAAKQQKGKDGSSNDAAAHPSKELQSSTLQHAAPSDVFSVQPSLLVSGADAQHKRPSGLTMVIALFQHAYCQVLKLCSIGKCCNLTDSQPHVDTNP